MAVTVLYFSRVTSDTVDDSHPSDRPTPSTRLCFLVYLIKRRHALPLPPPPSHLLSCHSRLALLDQGAARELRRAPTYLPTYRSPSPQLVTSRHLSRLASGRPVGVGAGTLFGLADNGLAGALTSPSCQLVIRALAYECPQFLPLSVSSPPLPTSPSPLPSSSGEPKQRLHQR